MARIRRAKLTDQNSNHTIKPIRVRFFLDYGMCFWYHDDCVNQELLEEALSPETQEQIHNFLREYDQFYGWGCPPNLDWNVGDCRRFNRECRRILDLVYDELNSHLKGRFLLCNEQFDLIEEASLLAEFNRRGRDFRDERKRDFYHDTEEY